MLNIITWFWGVKYSPAYVHILARSLRKHITQPYKFSVFTDESFLKSPEIDNVFTIPEESFYLLGKGCFIRLQMFSPEWQKKYKFDDRIVGIDLDSVITGPLDPLFDRPEPFVILQGANVSNPCPYNGALVMVRVGEHPGVWDDFSLEAVEYIPRYEWPDDQGWLWHKLPGAPGWPVGPKSGIYVYRKREWPKDDQLPVDARIVTFVGKRNPVDLLHLKWVKENWV